VTSGSFEVKWRGKFSDFHVFTFLLEVLPRGGLTPLSLRAMLRPRRGARAPEGKKGPIF